MSIDDFFFHNTGGPHRRAGWDPALNVAGDAVRSARRAQTEAEDLQRRYDRLHLATAAMWALMKEKLGVTDEELAAKMKDLDVADGVEDGRMAPPPMACAECGRSVGRGRDACMYCGHAAPRPPV